MAFPFPVNPVDGQQVTYTNSKGRLMVATYYAAKNEWEVTTALPPSHNVGSTPSFDVLPGADQSSVVWDQTLGKWVAKRLTYKTQDLTDVANIVPTNNQILKWNDAAKQYQPASQTGLDVWESTADQVAVRPGATPADKMAERYLALNPGGTPIEGEVILVTETANAANNIYVGSWFYNGTQWVLGASGGSAGVPKPTINYRATGAAPQAAGVLTGDLDVVTEVSNKQINVYNGTIYETVLRETDIKGWIAAGSLFQGAIDSLAGLGVDLPAPDAINKGFYWTWTGPASTNVTPGDFTNGGGFTTTLQVGDWIQSDGVKFIHVPSDLLSKLRWEGIGSFKTYADATWEKDSLVIRGGKYYRASAAVAPGDLAPEVAGSKWVNITPTYSLSDLTDIDVSGNTDLTKNLIVFNANDARYEAGSLNLDGLGDVVVDKRSNGQALADGDIVMRLGTQWVATSPQAWSETSLDFGDLKNVTITNPTDTQSISYDGALGVWKNVDTVRATVEFLSDIGDVEINQAPEVGQGLAWTGNKWVPKQFGGMDEWRADVTYAQNSLVLHKKAVWLATAEILPGNEPGGTNANSNLWKKETGTTIAELDDTNIGTPADGNLLRFHSGKWLNHAVAIRDLSDANIGMAPTEGQSLVYKNGKWTNTTPTVTSQTTVGDIKQSILTEVQFKAQMGADGGGWVLADGRNVSGSTYATITGQPNVPDLRGAYLRMAGQSSRDTGWNGGNLGSFQNDTTRLPRNTAFTTSNNGSHTHNIWGRRMANYSGHGYSSVPQTFNEGINAGGAVNTDGRFMDADGGHQHNVTGGDAETMPKTYSVNYYIKVN